MNAQRGFSLIELLVAIAIGLLLLLGLDTVFMSMSQTYTLRQKLSAFQESERMSMWFLSTSIRGAGYFPYPQTIAVATQFPAETIDGLTFSAAQVLSGNGSGNTDSIGVRFAASTNAFQGCSGQLTPGNTYTDIFGVSGGYLTCHETNESSGVNSSINLITGVSGLTVVYGVDSTGSGSITQYLTATQVGAYSYWVNVKSVTVTLQFVNPLKGQPGQPDTVSLTQTIPYTLGL